jgi:LysM repeat protein
MVAAGLLVALVVSNASASANLDSALSSIPAQEVVVEPGDSIWGLAGQHQVDGYSTSELAQWIYEKNSLSNSSLQPGQVLLVPASN